MPNQNVVEFTVEGLGKFSAFKELPAPQFFYEREREVARFLGGMAELSKLQAIIRTYRDSSDPYERNLAESAAINLMRAEEYYNLKTSLIDQPKGFSLDKLSVELFDSLTAEFAKARGFFRTGDSEPAAEITKVDQPTG